jgi:hypothetical protein
MLGLIGIHSFVTDPNTTKNHPKKYLEHVLLTQALSAYFWKKINGPIHLYTTERDAEFLKELKMLDIYDYVNTELLSRDEGIPWEEFGPVCKMRVAAHQQKFPFATIDNDLIFRTVLEENDLNSDLTLLHKEVFLHRNYPPLEYLGKREGYEFPAFASMQSDPINVGFLIWTNPQLVRDYWSYAFDYIKNNTGESRSFEWTVPGLPKFWKSLFVEQRLLANLIERDNYQTATLFPLKYSGDIEVWVNKKGEVKDFEATQTETKIDFYHMWGEKSLFYNFEPPICSSNQIRTLYRLISAANDLKDEKMNEILDEIILFTIEKTFSLGLEDFYQLRTASKFLLK